VPAINVAANAATPVNANASVFFIYCFLPLYLSG
jgi:hypothetical protein